ncbi:hypothetical protein [Dulcicalothrix desertica]|uniref:hypothetical protein n=1 Tax=Dulcicalothrix desertica TaxID=32056 RepID=UPI0013153312|nr:hypothetical protein [Dulcicalothrix desertica]
MAIARQIIIEKHGRRRRIFNYAFNLLAILWDGRARMPAPQDPQDSQDSQKNFGSLL